MTRGAANGRAGPGVLLVATDLSTGGGVNRVIRDLAVLFKTRLGMDVAVVAARGEGNSTYPFPPDVPLEQYPRQSLISYFQLLLRLRRRRPGFVIGSWTQDNILIALAFLLSSTKTVLVEHTSWHFHPPLIRLLRRLVYPLAWRVIVLNPAEQNHYASYLRNVRLIPNPVATGASSQKTAREKLILAVGHLEPRKNFADAIRAMALSRLESDGWSLAIIGSGPETEHLGALVDELGLERTSIHTATADLQSWYARSSLTLVTARVEVFSLVLAEAMLAGVVPIAYATDGPSFILEDFPDHLVDIGDVDGLAERLTRFATTQDNDALRRKLRAAIETRFSVDVIAEEWRELVCSGAAVKRR